MYWTDNPIIYEKTETQKGYITGWGQCENQSIKQELADLKDRAGEVNIVTHQCALMSFKTFAEDSCRNHLPLPAAL